MNLTVRCLALTAGTTAFIGFWASLPFALNTALTIPSTTILIAVIVGTLIMGVVLNSREHRGRSLPAAPLMATHRTDETIS